MTVKHHEGSNPMSMTFDAANRLVTTQQGSNIGTYTFDANGNMTGEQVGGLRITFVYDQENRQLHEIRSSGARHTYTYEPDGLRRSAFHAGTADVVTFVWDGDDLLNERIEGANAARYAVLEGEILSEKRGASRYRFVPDPLGSVRALLDTTGSITATRDYWPYGEIAAQSGGMTSLQFVGVLGYFTDTTNRIYVRARHYRPDLGRWQTQDEYSEERPAWSGYAYVRGRPSVLVDPTGHIRGFPGGVPDPTQPFYGYDPPWGNWCIHLWGNRCIGPGCVRDPTCRSHRRPCIEVGAVYGEFCGPQNVPGDPAFTRGALDECCRKHDACFGNHDCPIPVQYLRRDCLKCNWALCDCALGARCLWYDEQCRAMRRVVLAYSCVLRPIGWLL